MNILLVTETYLPYITGVSVSTDSIARYMVSRGHTVTIVCPKQLVKGTVTPLKGLTIITVPNIPFALANQNSIGIFPLGIPIIKRLVKENKFDIVHIQEPMPTGISALIVAKKYGIPTVGALHFIPEQGDRNIFGGRAEKTITFILDRYIEFIYNKYDKIMTVSNFFAERLKKIGVKKPVFVISNGTDTEKFHPAPLDFPLRNRLGIPKDSIVFFYLGRLDGDKNVATTIKALPFVDEKVRLLVVGKGKQKTKLLALEEKLKVSSKIVWVDYITDEEMPDYYHTADVFSIMSQFEGQSIVTLQAAASGLPILAANASALPEICHDHKNGFLVDTYDYKTLAARMDELVHNPKMRQEFGIESRKISLIHNKPVVLHKLELLYKSLI